MGARTSYNRGAAGRSPHARSEGRVALFLVVGRFFVPFALLLLRSPKKKPRQLCMIAGWLVFMQLVDIYVVILPALHGAGLHVSIWDFVCLIAIGTTLAFFYLRILARTSLFPNRDPRLLESLRTIN